MDLKFSSLTKEQFNALTEEQRQDALDNELKAWQGGAMVEELRGRVPSREEKTATERARAMKIFRGPVARLMESEQVAEAGTLEEKLLTMGGGFGNDETKLEKVMRGI